jgi:signal transduction histidine kinase
VVQWRDWSLPVKLSAVTLVPIIIALVLGIITIASQVQRSESYQRIDRLVTLSGDVRALLDGLQQERTRTADLLSQGTVGVPPELQGIRDRVDKALPAFRNDAVRAVELEPGMAANRREAEAQLARLRGIRDQVGAGQLDPIQAVTEYSSVTVALLKVDTALAAGISDTAIGGTPSALHNLQVVKEQLTFDQAVISHGISRGSLPPSELSQVRNAEIRLADRLTDFRAAANQTQRQLFDSTVAGPNFNTRDQMVQTALSDQGTVPVSNTRDRNPNRNQDNAGNGLRSLSARQWNDSSSAVAARVVDVANKLGDQMQTGSKQLVEDASSGAGLLAVLLFAALVLAAAVVFLITRQLLSSLRTLRNSALRVAEKVLPDAVRNIQEGRAQETDVEPVPVEANDEVGEVARAFDAVHSQALRLAVEQAAMRTGYSSVFVNLSRRSQSLVQRQLQLIERLERDEEDADQLATLFQLDHLATRMRRNNENLMVLSGSEPSRRSGQPVTTTDVLRAAVSEIEQYQRVVVQTPPDARIVGYAASDLMRLVAELLDNATAFSAPETQVTVSTRKSDDGTLVVDILDKGIGMNAAEVGEANARLAEAATVDLATSRRMGLFVVGRLASRHGIDVSLHGGKDIVGVRATVTVPAELIMPAPGEAGKAPASATSGSGSGTSTARSRPPRPTPPAPPAQRTQSTPAEPFVGSSPEGGSLPRRQRSVNGVPRQGGGVSAFDDGQQAKGAPLDRRAPGGQAAPAAYSGLDPEEPLWPDREMSGTALFSPIRDDDESPQAQAWPNAEPASGEPTGLDAPSRPRPPAPAPRERGSGDQQLPSGKALFQANKSVLSEWWKQAPQPGEAPAPAPRPAPKKPADLVDRLSETTPIFDEMLSAWFRSDAPPPGKVSKGASSSKAAADVKRVADSKAAEARAAETKAAEAKAAEARAAETRAAEARAAAESRATSGEPAAAPAETGARAEKAPLPAEAGARSTERVADTVDASAEKSGSSWDFASDQNLRTVQAVSQAEPSTFTSAGLPRRRRGEQLLPGSALPGNPVAQAGAAAQGSGGDSGAEHRDLPTRDPSDIRGRLSSFQQGVNRGRRAKHSEVEVQPQPQPQSSPEPEQSPLPQRPAGSRSRSQFGQDFGGSPSAHSPAPSPAPLPSRPSAQSPGIAGMLGTGPGSGQAPGVSGTGGLPRRSTPSAPASGPAPAPERQEETASAWSFSTDESWRTVQTVSQSVPSSFTPAGLPRRRRGEQLLPGSLSSSNQGPRSERDPQDMRGRLSSFQQGVRRGRHQATQPAEGNRETMEGE